MNINPFNYNIEAIDNTFAKFVVQRVYNLAINSSSDGLPPFGGPGLKLAHRRSCDDGRAGGRTATSPG